MSKLLLHTPEGVRDIYGNELYMKRKTEGTILKTFQSFGFHEIETPSFEYFSVFGNQVGTIPSRELYKFFDKEGNTLALRPDFTPSMARCAAKYYMDEDLPIRFCYAGKAFTNTSSLQGKLNEETQAGVELMNDASAYADAEMIHMMITSLLEVGLKDFYVSVGQIDYFRGICENEGMSEELIETVREFISLKNFFGLSDYLKDCNVSEDIQKQLVNIQDLFGDIEVVEKALETAENACSAKALRRLKEIYDFLRMYGVQDYVIFDLGMVSKINYYTGVLFKAYTYGVGEAVAKGGRYDGLLSQFGKDASAIGFSIIIDDLLSAMDSQKLTEKKPQDELCFVYDEPMTEKMIRLKEDLRKKGIASHFLSSAFLDRYDDFKTDYRKVCRFKEDDIIDIESGKKISIESIN